MKTTPTLLAHADWGSQPDKRWLARATRQPGGTYLAHQPEPVGRAERLPARLLAAAGPEGSVLLGVDLPLGLPIRYACQVGIDDFLRWLPQLGHGPWADFYHVAETPAQIGLHRPFYPQRPGGTRQQHLLDALNVRTIDDLRRRCDRARPGRRAAAPLFWTMGGQQVGKAALHGWRTLLIPALQDPAIDLVIWPFSGPLFDLIRPQRIIAAETYPAECYAHLGVTFPRRPGRRSGKRVQADRAANGPILLAWAGRVGLALTPALQAQLESGFGQGPGGEDPFDATIGLFGVVNVILGHRSPGVPNEPIIRQVEGWILGQEPDLSPS